VSRYASFILCATIALLVALGMVMLASTSTWLRGIPGSESYVTKQSMILGLGIICTLVISFINLESIKKYWLIIFGIGCLLLVLCYIPGIGKEVNGASRWIKFPGIPQFQSSEIGKITTLIGIAGWYAAHVSQIKTFWNGFIVPSIILGIPAALILFEKDMDTAAALGLTGFAVFFCVGARLIYLLPVSIVGAALLIFMVRHDTTRSARVNAWLKLEENLPEYRDINRQQYRALLAYGSGGPEGKGLGNGVEKHGYMPEAHTDFILPVIGEELGLYFTLGVVICYVFFTISGFMIAMQASEVFSRTLGIGITLIILLPALINIAVTTGKLPNAGLPLPFISYGGTNLLFSLCSIAILLSIARHTKIERRDLHLIPKKPSDMKL
jgi:cell division protein FtsW